MKKLPAVGTLLVRPEAPTMRYRVTSINDRYLDTYARLLPYRFSGREVFVSLMRGVLVGDGSVWHPTGEVA